MTHVLINKLLFEFFGYKTVACFLPIPVYNIFKYNKISLTIGV